MSSGAKPWLNSWPLHSMGNTGPILSRQNVTPQFSMWSISKNILTVLANFLGIQNPVFSKNISRDRGNTTQQFKCHSSASCNNQPIWPPLPSSNHGTFNYSFPFPTCSHFTPKHLQSLLPLSPLLPFSNVGASHYLPNFSMVKSPLQLDTWPNTITDQSPMQLPIWHLGTSDHIPTVSITLNVTPGYIELPTHFHHHLQCHKWAPPIAPHLSHQSQFDTQTHLITHPLFSPLTILHPGTYDCPPTFPTTPNFTHGHFQWPSHFTNHFQFPTWAPPISHSLSPPLPISQLGTTDYPPTFSTTVNFTNGHLQSPSHFTDHFQFPTWAPSITVHYPPTFPTTANFTHGHLRSPSHFTGHFQFPTSSHYPPTFATTVNFTHADLWSPSHFTDHFQFPTWAPPIIHPISIPLPISHPGTSDYPPTFSTTPNFTHEHLRSSPTLPITFIVLPGHLPLPTHFPHHSQFHTWPPPIPPTLLITSNILPGHLPLPTHFHHQSQFHTLAHPICYIPEILN